MKRTAWVGVLAFIADRVTKQLAAETLRIGETRVLWDGVLQLTHARNTGIAFSILADRTWLLIVVSALALILLVEAFRRTLRRAPVYDAALWLLLAGGVGNLADRLCYGYVIDFISPQFLRFPVFNLADVCLTVSAAFLVFALLRSSGIKEKDARNTDEQSAA